MKCRCRKRRKPFEPCISSWNIQESMSCQTIWISFQALSSSYHMSTPHHMHWCTRFLEFHFRFVCVHVCVSVVVSSLCDTTKINSELSELFCFVRFLPTDVILISVSASSYLFCERRMRLYTHTAYLPKYSRHKVTELTKDPHQITRKEWSQNRENIIFDATFSQVLFLSLFSYFVFGGHPIQFSVFVSSLKACFFFSLCYLHF